MKKTMLASALALLAACGSSTPGVSSGSATGQTSASAPATSIVASDNTVAVTTGGTVAPGDTKVVSSFSDMPPACVGLFTTFLKQIEPKVSTIDWNTATVADFEAFGKEFQPESDDFDTKSAAAGCDKFKFDASDTQVFKEITELATTSAPGTLPFLNFLNSLSATATAGTGSVPADCAGTIAEIEPFLGTGKTMKGLTLAELTRLRGLVTAVSTNCSADESTAFFGRDDVKAFVSG